MKPPDPPSDRDIAEAFLALDGTIPDGHLDDFSSRVLARLDEPEVSDMDSRELARGSGLSRTDEAALGAAAASATPEPVRDENSGLHEIKALASTTRRRISKKITSETEAEESLLVGAASGSFRASAAAALPDPARQTSTSGELTDDRAALRGRERLSGARPVARPAAEVDRPLPSRGSSMPFWLLGGVATAAAAAAVAVFVFGVGRTNKNQDPNQAASGSDIVARAESPAPAAPAATGSGSADGDMRFADPPPPPAEAAPGAQAAATSAPALVARSDESQASDEGGAEGRVAGGATDEKKEAAKPADRSTSARKKLAKEKEKSEVQSKPDAKGGGGKDLNDVLDEVTGGVKAPTAPVQEEKVAKPSKKGLDRSDVSKAMSAVRSQVMRCRDKEQFEGTVTVKFHVAPSGAVTSAEATGSKAGSSTGACVAAAVKRARFPAFDGSSTSFTYPFLLAE